MANCKKCNAEVGCGCQLKNGLCAACQKTNTAQILITTNNQNDVTTKTN